MSYRLTVCIPTYNRRRYLPKVIEGLAFQAYRDFKILVYDDASTDGTVEWLKEFSRRYLNLRGRLIIHQAREHRGHGYARKWFKDNVDTELWAWMDSDDWCRPGRLVKQVLAIDQYRLDCCFCWMMFFQGEDPFKDPMATRTIRKIHVANYSRHIQSIHNNTNTATGVFNRAAADCIPDLEINEGNYDTLWIMKMICSGLRIGCVEEPLYHCRRHGGRLSQIGRSPERREAKQRERLLMLEELRKMGVEGLPEPKVVNEVRLPPKRGDNDEDEAATQEAAAEAVGDGGAAG